MILSIVTKQFYKKKKKIVTKWVRKVNFSPIVKLKKFQYVNAFPNT